MQLEVVVFLPVVAAQGVGVGIDLIKMMTRLVEADGVERVDVHCLGTVLPDFLEALEDPLLQWVALDGLEVVPDVLRASVADDHGVETHLSLVEFPNPTMNRSEVVVVADGSVFGGEKELAEESSRRDLVDDSVIDIDSRSNQIGIVVASIDVDPVEEFAESVLGLETHVVDLDTVRLVEVDVPWSVEEALSESVADALDRLVGFNGVTTNGNRKVVGEDKAVEGWAGMLHANDEQIGEKVSIYF